MNTMENVNLEEAEIVAKLRRLDAVTGADAPGFDYAGLLERQEAARVRARRRRGLARGTASAVVFAMVALSAWRLAPHDEPVADAEIATVEPRAKSLLDERANAPRLVRADTWLALAALEDHIATIDDALNDARLRARPGAESLAADVARLERTRAELVDSYAQVRYAEMVSNNF